MTFLAAVFDFIKSLAWPLLVGGFAYYFREEIRGLFKRVQKIGLDGAQFETSPAQIPAPAQQTIDTHNLQDVGLPRTEFMANLERKFLADVNLVAAEKQIPLVVRHLAQARIELACERIYSVIFGSQIEELREIEKANGRVSIAEGKRHFENVKATFPFFYEKVDFWQWLSYLSRSDLVTVTNEAIQLLPFGNEFLSYVASRGLPNRYY